VNLPKRRSSVYAVRDNSSLHWRPATNEYARNVGDSRRILKIPKISFQEQKHKEIFVRDQI